MVGQLPVKVEGLRGKETVTVMVILTVAVTVTMTLMVTVTQSNPLLLTSYWSAKPSRALRSSTCSRRPSTATTGCSGSAGDGEGQGRGRGRGGGGGRGVDAVKARSVGLVVVWATHAPEGWGPPPGARWCRP